MQFVKLCRSHRILSPWIVNISRPWVLKPFLQNKNKIHHRTFPKFGLYFWRFFLGFASILDGENHVAHQIKDFFTCHLRKIKPKLTHLKSSDCSQSALNTCSVCRAACLQGSGALPQGLHVPVTVCQQQMQKKELRLNLCTRPLRDNNPFFAVQKQLKNESTIN